MITGRRENTVNIFDCKKTTFVLVGACRCTEIKCTCGSKHKNSESMDQQLKIYRIQHRASILQVTITESYLVCPGLSWWCPVEVRMRKTFIWIFKVIMMICPIHSLTAPVPFSAASRGRFSASCGSWGLWARTDRTSIWHWISFLNLYL